MRKAKLGRGEEPEGGKRSMHEKEQLSLDIKNNYIKELEGRNRKLKYQIIKINEMLQQQQEKKDKEYMSRSRKKIIQDSTEANLKKELEIIYTYINNYEKEIKAIESKQTGLLIIQKVSRLQTVLQERNDHLEKVKAELVSLQKHSYSNVKKLKNRKEEMEGAMIKANEEIKMLRTRIKDLEAKSKRKKENAQKQYNYVKRLEKELLEEGVGITELEELKEIKNQYLDDILNPPKNAKQEEAKEEESKAKKLNEMKNEVKLLKKLHPQYEKKIQQLEESRREEEEESISLMRRIDDKNQEIQELNDQIEEYRAKVNKVNIKPTYSYPKPPPEIKKEKPQMLPTLIKKPEVQKVVIEVLPIKYDQKGKSSQNGKRFTDRGILGKRTDVRIIGVKFWTQKQTFAINGAQCTYLIGGEQKKIGPQHINKEAKKHCSENTMDLQDGDFLRTVSGHINEKNVIEYLVLISKKKVVGRFGMAKQSQKQFNFNIEENEVPICMYGSILKTKDAAQKKEGSILENLGFQICQDKSYRKDDKFRV